MSELKLTHLSLRELKLTHPSLRELKLTHPSLRELKLAHRTKLQQALPSPGPVSELQLA